MTSSNSKSGTSSLKWRNRTKSLGIHDELNSQNRMLDDMENDLENATTNLEIVTKKTKDLIKKSGGKRNFMIIVSMCLVVAILLFLILYT